MSDPRTTWQKTAGAPFIHCWKRRSTKPRVRYRSLMSANSVAFAAANAHIKVLYFLLSYSLQSQGGEVSGGIVIRGWGFSIHAHKQALHNRVCHRLVIVKRLVSHLISPIWGPALTSGSLRLRNSCLHSFTGVLRLQVQQTVSSMPPSCAVFLYFAGAVLRFTFHCDSFRLI